MLTSSWSGDTIATERRFPRHELIGNATPSDDTDVGYIA